MVKDRSYPLIILFIFIFYAFCFFYIKRNRDAYAVYSRSYLLIIISLLISFVGSLIFLSSGILNVKYTSRTAVSILMIFAMIIVEHSFYIVNLLKLYRVILLNRLSNADFQLNASSKLKIKLGGLWNIKVGVSYTLLSLIPRIILYLSDLETSSNIKFQEWVQTSLESIAIFIYLIYIYKSDCDVTLRIEYLFYAIGWLAGLVVTSQGEEELLFLIVMPVRNMSFTLINSISIYEHVKHYKLPLPDFIDLDLVLHHRFLATQTRDYLKLKKNKKWIILFELLLDICIFLEKEAAEYQDIIRNDLYKYSTISGFSPTLGRNDFSEEIKEIYNQLYYELDEEFFRNFVDSAEFNEIRIEYGSL